jgi:hypothetical protein
MMRRTWSSRRDVIVADGLVFGIVIIPTLERMIRENEMNGAYFRLYRTKVKWRLAFVYNLGLQI